MWMPKWIFFKRQVLAVVFKIFYHTQNVVLGQKLIVLVYKGGNRRGNTFEPLEYITTSLAHH